MRDERVVVVVVIICVVPQTCESVMYSPRRLDVVMRDNDEGEVRDCTSMTRDGSGGEGGVEIVHKGWWLRHWVSQEIASLKFSSLPVLEHALCAFSETRVARLAGSC
jgi:hypothetical protein